MYFFVPLLKVDCVVITDLLDERIQTIFLLVLHRIVYIIHKKVNFDVI
jgi:hypothetical protein